MPSQGSREPRCKGPFCKLETSAVSVRLLLHTYPSPTLACGHQKKELPGGKDSLEFLSPNEMV